MGKKVRFISRDLLMTATLNDSAAAAAVASHLPLEGLAQTAGAEVYFFIEFSVDDEDPTEDAPPGTIAYWPAGSAICVFFGAQPITPVTVIGTLDGNPNEWRNVISGSEVRLEKV
ncbi:MAG: hypothetical protein J7M19_00580 [Planctomycetes bacterium]|nr:hypothetical protein [Planctomycetota bacterium]